MKSIKRGEQLSNKLDKLASQFDIIESAADEIDAYVSEKLPIEEIFEVAPIEVDTEIVESIIELKLLKEDFSVIRHTIMANVSNGKLILQSLTDELLMSDSERKSSMITSFAELTNATNQSLKVLSTIYKDIVHVEKEIINFSSSPEVVNNTQTNVLITSTSDIIKELRENLSSKD